MKVVFEASTGIDAHLIKNLLEQHDIAARVDGEYLQGGVGDLQAINIVRVVVDGENYAKASEIVKEWESQEEPVIIKEVKETNKKHKPLYTIISIFVGIIIGISTTIWHYDTPMPIGGIDHNNDGVLDEKWIYKKDKSSQSKVDRNFDGKIDVINYFNRQGVIETAEADDDFDGVFETKYKFTYGSLVHQKSDLDQDGNIDLEAYFKFGVLYKIKIIGNKRSAPTKWQQYKLGKLISAKYDSNGDGKFDVVHEYDFFEEVK